MAEAEWHPKREAKRFEPPPWELDRFEALKQSRDQQDAEETQAETASPEPAEAAAESSAELAEVREAAAEREAEPEAPAPAPRAGKASAVPDAQADAMLIQLGAEEPRVDEHLKVVGVFGSAISMFFGVCMLGWGLFMFATAKGNFAAVVGALIVLGMGVFLSGIGFWFGWRVTNRGD